jgi:hypothetical protein
VCCSCDDSEVAHRPGSLLALIAVATLAARYGGDGSDQSKAEYVRKANAVCSESNERVRALGPEPPILTADQADWIEALTESDRSAVAKLRDLEPPESGRATIDAMLSDFERGLGKGETIAEASRAKDDPRFRQAVAGALAALMPAERAATDYGLGECARLGLVVR